MCILEQREIIAKTSIRVISYVSLYCLLCLVLIGLASCSNCVNIVILYSLCYCACLLELCSNIQINGTKLV